MKYLKLFEAFESKTISKVMKFINKKGIDDKSFRNSLTVILKGFNIPIDKIKDSDVSYLNKLSALKIKNDTDVSNDFGVYCLKFWFSIEDGYLGYTGVGNKKINYNKWLIDKNNDNKKFDLDSLEYIKNSLGITKGEIEPIKHEDYLNIKTGDKLIGFFERYDDECNLNKLAMAKAWVDDDEEYIYAIQDVSSGTTPDSDTQEIDGVETNWREFGEYVWCLGRKYRPASDHHSLHRYKENDEDLHYSKNLEEETNFLDFNLPLSYRCEIVDWSSGGSIGSVEVLEKADFAVVFYIDNMLDPDKAEFYEKPSDIKKQRSDDRKGATKLLSDYEIKNINIDRYMSKLISKMGIKEDISELKNLQKVFSKILCKEFALISLISDRPRMSNITSFSNKIKEIISGDNDLVSMISIYKTINKQSTEYYKLFNDSKDLINKKEYNTEIFNKIYEIGNYIYQYFSTNEINTIQDLKMALFKMRSISALYDDVDFRLNDRLTKIIHEFYDESDVDYYSDRNTKLDEKGISDSLKKLEAIERYVKSILN